MKTFKYLFAGVCSVFMLISCLGEYQDLNTDPEQLSATDPRSEFTGATQNFNNCSRNHLTGKYHGTMISGCGGRRFQRFVCFGVETQ